MTVQEYARSHENRPLVYAVLTSPVNHTRLDEIVEANRRIYEAQDVEKLATLGK